MAQILHIFRKDLRRFWLEILLALLAAGAFAWCYPWLWLPHPALALKLGDTGLDDVQRAAAYTSISIVPLTWLVLIGRVVQDEGLVGDRQYWVTRPFDWRLLLAEKCLFVALFLVLPLALAELVLLHRAGFPVAPYGGALAAQLLCSTGFFLVPLFTLATVTRDFLRLCLTILGILVAIAGLAALSERLTSVSTPYSDTISPVLFVISCALVVLVQYASRTVWVARGFLLVCLLLVVFVTSGPLDSYALEHFYYPPVHEGTMPVRLRLAQDPARRPSLAVEDDKHLTLYLPVDVSDVPPGMSIRPEDIRVRLDAADGSHWQSGWQPVSARVYRPPTELGVLTVTVDRAWIKRVRARPIGVSVSLALTAYETGREEEVIVPQQREFSVPHVGICAVDPDLSLAPGLTCRWPFRAPPRVLLVAPWSTGDCSADRAPAEHTAYLTAEVGATVGTQTVDGSDIGLTPVFFPDLAFDFTANTDTAVHPLPPLRLCPGSTLLVYPLQLVKRGTYTLPTQTIELPPPARNLLLP